MRSFDLLELLGVRLPCLRSFVLIEAPRDVCGGIFLWCFFGLVGGFWVGVGFLGFGFADAGAVFLLIHGQVD